MSNTPYLSRPTRWLVTPGNDTCIFANYGYTVELDDEGAGEYVRVCSHTEDTPGEHAISVENGQWHALRAAIDAAFDEVAKYSEGNESPPPSTLMEIVQAEHESYETDELMTLHFATGSKDALHIGAHESRYDAGFSIADEWEAEEQMREQVKAWQSTGEKGRSSEAMASALLGAVEPAGGSFSNDYPRDPSDFRRCVQLLDAAPLARGYLYRVADVGLVWGKFVDRWDELEAMFKKELESGTGRAPMLYATMQEMYR